MSQPEPKVFIVEDDASTARATQRLLRTYGYQTCVFANAADFFEQADLEQAGYVLLDVQLPGLSGPDVQKRLHQQQSPPPIIFLTGHGNIPMSVESMRLGASDFLEKPVDETVLLSAIERCFEQFLQSRSAVHERESALEKIARLTPRELEVLRHVITGAPNKTISRHLGIAEKTVKVHRSHIIEKLGKRSPIELAQFCAAANIEPASPPPNS